MTILITGVAGFIGSNLSDYLLSKNHIIIGVDNFDNFYDPLIKKQNLILSKKNKNFYFFEGSILDRIFLDNIFRKHNIELVIHLAAKAGVRPSIIYAQEYFNVNVNGTINLLEVMKKNDIKKMIFASSSSVYGNSLKFPFSEEDNVDFPISPYAATKKSAELVCHTYHHLHNFDIFCMRFFTVYGPRQRPDLAIHKFTDAIMKGNPITIYGDGNTRRDYTHISDIILGLENTIYKLTGYEIINLGESSSVNLLTLISLIEKYTGKKAQLKKLPMQPGDVLQTHADLTKAEKIIDYKPKVAFENGLKDFVDWYRSVN